MQRKQQSAEEDGRIERYGPRDCRAGILGVMVEPEPSSPGKVPMSSSAAMSPVVKRPKTRPAFEERDLEPVDWHLMVDQFVHELKIAIAEALDWIRQPLSAKELWMILGPGRYKYDAVAYHTRTLEEQGVTVEVWEREARGASEIYYLARGNPWG